jgi:carbonic anhydrase/acetyltransferase-like protein (isoleucine patch superfamily)
MLYLTTSDSLVAREIGKQLLEKKLAVCINIIPINSMYMMKDNLMEENECGVLIKTLPEFENSAVEFIKSIHPYDTPFITRISDDFNFEYKEWAKQIQNSNLKISGKAIIEGNVKFNSNCTVLPGAVIRGDKCLIEFGNNCNIQDNAVVHYEYDSDLKKFEIGNNVSIGHGAIVHCRRIGNNVLIGMGSILSHGAIIDDNVIIGAGALIPPNKKIESGVYMGVPATKVRDLTQEDKELIEFTWKSYVEKKERVC